MPSATSASSRSDRQPTTRQAASGLGRTGDTSEQQVPLLLPKYYLPYQSRGKEFMPSLSHPSSVPNKNDITATHRTMRVGLGTPVNNLRATAIVNSKRDVKIDVPKRKIVPKSFQKATKNKDSVSSVASKLQRLKIYEDPGNDDDDSEKSCQAQESVWKKSFKLMENKANLLAQGHKVPFKCRGDVFTVQKDLKSAEESVVFKKLVSRKDVPDYCKPKLSGKNEDRGDNTVSKKREVDPSKDVETKAMANLIKHFRGILGWQMSLSIKWNLVEERVKLWPNNVPLMPLEEAADILKINVDDLKALQIVPDFEEMFFTLKSNLCHSAYPNLAKVMSLSELNKGNRTGAAKYAAESTGMFLHSEIVDKHLGYIRRGEELIQESTQGENDKLRTSIFLQQVNDTLDFTNKFYETQGDSSFANKISAINPDWNIVQLTTANDSINLFSNDFLKKRQVPQIILSAFCSLPGQKSKTIFTSSCMGPKLEVGSQMRNGLMDEFQRLLDKNLAISDETTVISRKKYWEERARHNDTMEGVILAMEDWIKPWSFLFPGRIKDDKIRKAIQKEILGHPLVKKSPETQKLLICRLVENCSFISAGLRAALGSFVAKILDVREEEISSLKEAMMNIVTSISSDTPRHPTILILDNQELDVLPWDWMTCLRTTDVTRMPSLNLINSTGNILSTLQRPCPVVIDPDQCTFILNPDGSLPNVQKRLESYLTDRKEWTPIVGRSPTAQEMQDVLEQKDIMLYCGHGHGSQFYPEYALQKLVCKAVPLLMGCSSAQSQSTGPRLYGSSIINTYFIAGCASIVGFLWEVTDTECDRLTVDLLERWVPHPLTKPPVMPFFDIDAQRDKEDSLITAVRKCRTAATQFLTRSAAVCYGLPVMNTRRS